MRSVADDLRLETLRAGARLKVSERIALALRLGDEDVARYQATHGVTEREARGRLARARQVGRTPSPANDPDRR
jgi:hypothetical protein